jgi:hypothetical protein
MEIWITEMNTKRYSLQVFFAEGKDRHINYKKLINALMSEVRADKN